jgi:hypothetical protein
MQDGMQVETEPQQRSDHEEQERPHYFIPSNLNLIDRDVNAQVPNPLLVISQHCENYLTR